MTTRTATLGFTIDRLQCVERRDLALNRAGIHCDGNSVRLAASACGFLLDILEPRRGCVREAFGLHANNLKVAALLDSDAAGDQAAQQDALVGALGHQKIIRTRDAYADTVAKPEIEDLLRDRLVALAKADLGWDIEAKAAATPNRPIVGVFAAEIPDFKYKLAKAYVRWTRGHEAAALTADECVSWTTLIENINSALR